MSQSALKSQQKYVIVHPKRDWKSCFCYLASALTGIYKLVFVFFLPFLSLENLSYLQDLSCVSFIKRYIWLYDVTGISIGMMIYMPYRLFN